MGQVYSYVVMSDIVQPTPRIKSAAAQGLVGDWVSAAVTGPAARQRMEFRDGSAAVAGRHDRNLQALR